MTARAAAPLPPSASPQVACKHFRGWETPGDLAALRGYMAAFMARPSWQHTVYSPEAVIAGWARHGIEVRK